MLLDRRMPMFPIWHMEFTQYDRCKSSRIVCTRHTGHIRETFAMTHCTNPLRQYFHLAYGRRKDSCRSHTGIQPEPFVMSVYSEKTMMVFCLLCEFRDKYLVHQTIDFIQSSFDFTFIQSRYNINKTSCGGGGGNTIDVKSDISHSRGPKLGILERW